MQDRKEIEKIPIEEAMKLVREVGIDGTGKSRTDYRVSIQSYHDNYPSML